MNTVVIYRVKYRVNWMALFGCREIINKKAWNGCQGCLVDYGYGTSSSSDLFHLKNLKQNCFCNNLREHVIKISSK